MSDSPPEPLPSSSTSSVAPVQAPVRCIGVGASAGGLEALEHFVGGIPADSDCAFFILQHLSPDYESRMDDLLGRKTSLRIEQARHEIEVRPNVLYLLPPRKEMIISDGRLLLKEKESHGGVSLPIDHFLKSLAQESGECAIAVILSGTGSDGSRGVVAVAESGGFVIAQDPDSARFTGMPESAIDTGVVNRVLPPERMMEAILNQIENLPEKSCEEQDFPAPLPKEQEMEAIFTLLQTEYGINFHHYKPTTVLRRIERRLDMAGIDLGDYAMRIERDPDELSHLYRDLLIGVTKFFRDPEAYEALLAEETLDALFASARAERELRVWCAGCATGEEPYSLAILLEEERRRRGERLEIKVFATDVHRQSLEFAGKGIYPEESLSEVRPEWRERHFREISEGMFKVASEIRQMVIFAHHNVIKSAPFTRMDLVSCRNLLIYFRPAAQQKAISLFHFGMKTGGVLFLGPSETPGDLLEEFDTVDAHWKIYRKKRDVRLPTETRTVLPQIISSRQERDNWSRSVGDHDLLQVYDDLLYRFVPAGILVDERFHLLHTFGDADKFMRLNRGRPTTHLLDLLTEELQTPIGGALQHAARKGESVTYTGIPTMVDDEEKRFDLTITVLGGNGRKASGHYFLAFETGRDPSRALERLEGAGGETVDLSALTREHIDNIEQELRYTKENLQATIEELETSNEELQATNEELVASNEELQSSNEELHSVNEELHSVNVEHQRKISELSEMTSDLENLLTSTDVGVIFLDENLMIRKFTPRVRDFFDLLPQDIGRSIENFSHSLLSRRLFDSARECLRDGVVREREIRDRQGRIFLKRILPYRVKGKVEGVVLTFVDITEASWLQEQRDHLAAVVEHSPEFVCMTDEDLKCNYLNPAGRELVGLSGDEEIESKSVERWFEPERRAMVRERLAGLKPGGVVTFENTLRHEDGTSIPVIQVAIAHPAGEDEELIGFFSMVARDIRELKEKENSLRVLIGTLETVVEELPGIVLVYDSKGRLEFASNAATELLEHLEAGKESGGGRLPEPIEELLERALESGGRPEQKIRSFPLQVGKTKRHFQARVSAVQFEGSADTIAAIVLLEDVTEWETLDREKSDLIGAVSHELKNPIAAIQLPLMLMLEGKADDSPDVYRTLLTNMVDEVERMKRTVLGLLDLSRFEAEDGNLRRERTVVSAFLESVTGAVRSVAEREDVTINVVDETDDPELYLDTEKFRTALINIVHNAIKYSPPEGEVEIRVGYADKGRKKLRWEIRDEGPGIPKGLRDRVFERFYRIPDGEGKTGSGLGLSIARSFIEAHEGWVKVESGKGETRFIVTLPRFRPPAEQGQSRPAD